MNKRAKEMKRLYIVAQFLPIEMGIKSIANFITVQYCGAVSFIAYLNDSRESLCEYSYNAIVTSLE